MKNFEINTSTYQIVPNTIMFRFWNGDSISNDMAIEKFNSKSTESNVPDLSKFRFTTFMTSTNRNDEYIYIENLNDIILDVIGVNMLQHTNLKSFVNKKLYLKTANEKKTKIDGLLSNLETLKYTNNRLCIMVGFLNSCKIQVENNNETIGQNINGYNTISIKETKCFDLTMHNYNNKSLLLFEKFYSEDNISWKLAQYSVSNQICILNEYKHLNSKVVVDTLHYHNVINGEHTKNFNNSKYQKELRHTKLKAIFDE